MTEPIVRRKFIKFDPTENNNKFWLVELYADGTAHSENGRIDKWTQPHDYTGWTPSIVDAKVRAKIKEGYHEVDLHKPTIAPVAQIGASKITDPKVNDLIALIFKEAGEYIKSYLAVGVDALSREQIEKGRGLLSIINNIIAGNKNVLSLKDREAISDWLKQYFNTIPTQLPRNLREDWDYVVERFIGDLHEQEERLDQLETGLATYAAQQTGVSSQLAQLGDIEIATIPQSAKVYGEIYDYVLRTGGGSYTVRGIFSVSIKPERAIYMADPTGKSYVASMFHGTKSRNVRNILQTGLIIPRVAANGSRFGRGIYFADQARRSLGYTGGYGREKFLFVTDVALGNMKVLSGDDSSLYSAPAGYDSVRGIKSYSGMDEFVIFRPAQQTIRAIVLVE